jgi:methionyl-tRNA formyltransferase
MNFNKILILGSTYLTQLIVNKLQQSKYELVGYVESSRAAVSGNINLPIVDLDVEYDIALSLQYDKLIENPRNIFNLHTGLLPEYGGLDILRNTLKNNDCEQGMTFHKMGTEYDHGPIISKITYPVFENDTIHNLYIRQCSIAPNFIMSCLKLLEAMSEEEIDMCFLSKPKLYKRKYDASPIKLSKEDICFLESKV